MGDEEKRKSRESGSLKLDFSNFVLSLNASALIHLGDIPDPESRERLVNLPAAKHTIEILEIIKNKTVGNLDGEEQKLLDDVLYNLRMKYVKDIGSEKK
jgi:predicted phosphodiesterase